MLTAESADCIRAEKGAFQSWGELQRDTWLQPGGSPLKQGLRVSLRKGAGTPSAFAPELKCTRGGKFPLDKVSFL